MNIIWTYNEPLLTHKNGTEIKSSSSRKTTSFIKESLKMGLKPTMCWFESRIWKMVTVLILKDKTNVFSVLVFSRTTTTTTVQTQPADGSRDINIHSALPHSLRYNLLAGGGLLVGDTLSGPRCQRSRWSSTARQPSSVKQRRTFSCQKQKPSSFHFLCSSTTSAHSARHAPRFSRPLRFPLPAKHKNKCTKAARRGEAEGDTCVRVRTSNKLSQ